MDKIQIYCDGGCRGNQFKNNNIGGWGALIIDTNGEKYEYCDGTINTTNNIMELTSCIEALKVIGNKEIPVEVTMDSQYVVKGINEWIKNWIKKGWKTSTGKSVENLELWQELYELKNEFRNIKFKQCLGHSGNWGNERADKLANIAMDRVK